MPKYPQEQCEVCNEMVSTMPAAWANHKRRHEKEAAEAQEAKSGESWKPLTREDAAKITDDPDLAERLIRASRRADVLQKTAPDAHVMALETPNPMAAMEKELRSRGVIPIDMVMYFGREDEINRDEGRGCIPVIVDGAQVRYNELLGYMRSKDLQKREMLASAIQSKAMIGEALADGEETMRNTPTQGD